MDDNFDDENTTNIKQFTLDDYFSCEETRNIILDEWDEDFSYYLKDNICNTLNNHHEILNNSGSTLLYKTCNETYDDLANIVKHHIKKEYSISSFETNTSLAEPLIYKKNSSKKNEKKDIQNIINRILNKYDF